MLLRVFLCTFLLALLAVSAGATTFTVNKTADTNDGHCDFDCSLREAVFWANNMPSDDVIEFSALFATPQTITLAGTELLIINNGTLTINGPGADKLTISGNNASRIISTSPAGIVAISGIRFTAGNGVGATNSNSGGAIQTNGGNLTLSNSIVTGNTTSGSAGGVRNSGTGSVLTIINCVFSNNTAGSSGGALQNFSTSTITISNSAFIGNTSGGSTGGGAMQLNGMARITNSTFSGNNAPGGGGGAIQSNGSLLLLTNVTISGNTSTNNGGGLHRGTTNVNGFIRNSIISGNNGAAASPDVTNSAGGLASQGNNIIGIVGTSTGWIASDLQNTNPLLSPLGNHGGSGMTFALLSGSPAINAGQNCVVDLSCAANNPPAAVTTDQRGATRPTDKIVDIGAFESSSTYIAILPDARMNQAYDQMIAPNNGVFTYSVTSGSLPPGLQLTTAFSAFEEGSASPSAVVSINGTPTQTGTFNFAITITNGTNSAVVNYQITVTGAAVAVPVGGRVFSSPGRGLYAASVTITDGASYTRTVRTNQFGYYRFDGVPSQQTYTVSVSAKRYDYQPQVVNVTGAINDLNFSPVP